MKSCLAPAAFSYELSIQKHESLESCKMKWALLNRSSLQDHYIDPFLETPTIPALISMTEERIQQIPEAIYSFCSFHSKRSFVSDNGGSIARYFLNEVNSEHSLFVWVEDFKCCSLSLSFSHSVCVRACPCVHFFKSSSFK